MKKMKIVSVVGTRPEIIRLSRVFAELDKHSDHILIHTGQNYDYELNQIFFDELGIRPPDHILNCGIESNSSAQAIGKMIIEVDRLLEEINPDALLVLGDTNSALSVIAAKKRKIPIFHMEAGNRCFDRRVPEEINRKIVDHIADINLPYSSIARDYLIREGIPADQIIKTGSPMYEVLQHYLPKIISSNVLINLGIKEHSYFIVSAHREENIESESSFKSLIKTLNRLANEYDLPVIVSTHPRTQKRIDKEKQDLHSNVRLLKPLGFFDYVKLQLSSKAVLSDSGTITEESSILNFPALNLRDSHERPEGMEEATVIMTGLEENRVLQGLKLLELQFDRSKENIIVNDYRSPNVSEKIIRIILSYTAFIRKKDFS
jgi:UDP-N-acetylglucosamine 2-epimerase (non-hydrolysing)